jgi:hypothetical protein
MKLMIYLMAAFLSFASFSPLNAQEYGKIRALQQRASYVVKQKNDFVSRVLSSYAIPYERDAEGVLVRINMEGRWLDVTAIEIIPVLKPAETKQHVTAHELFFFTGSGILDLFSDLTIR